MTEALAQVTGACAAIVRFPDSGHTEQMRFRDRADAGARLGVVLERYRASQPVVVGLARGGVLVAAEVARQLGAPLYLTLVRKLGHPEQPELGLGALAEDGVPVWNEPVVGHFGIDARTRYEILSRERAAMEGQRETYRRGLLPADLTGRAVILVDDGLATGGSARAAIGFVRRRAAEPIVLAVPIGTPDVVSMLRLVADEVFALVTPAELAAVGQWYDQFDQCADAAVLDQLQDRY